MSDKPIKLNEEEKAVWDKFVSLWLPNTYAAHNSPRDTAGEAAKLADALIEERRKRIEVDE